MIAFKKASTLLLFYLIYTSRDSQAFEATDSYGGFALGPLGFSDTGGKLLFTILPKYTSPISP